MNRIETCTLQCRKRSVEQASIFDVVNVKLMSPQVLSRWTIDLMLGVILIHVLTNYDDIWANIRGLRADCRHAGLINQGYFCHFPLLAFIHTCKNTAAKCFHAALGLVEQMLYCYWPECFAVTFWPCAGLYNINYLLFCSFTHSDFRLITRVSLAGGLLTLNRNNRKRWFVWM